MELSGLHKTWLFTGLIALACAIDADRLGAGKPCTSDGRCADGYHCSAERRCVASPVSRDGSAGSAGTAAGDSGSGETSGSGGSGSEADVDAQSASDGASFEASLPDAHGQDGTLADAAASNDAPPPDTGCASPTRYYVDGDRDGFGRDDSALWACARPSGSWATRGADCNDADNRVFPGQTAFFASAFTYAAGDSFDYDCSGGEQPDPAQQGPAPNCADLPVSDCTGAGFASTGRAGATADPTCGSTRLVECVPALLVCSAMTSTTQPKRCH